MIVFVADWRVNWNVAVVYSLAVLISNSARRMTFGVALTSAVLTVAGWFLFDDDSLTAIGNRLVALFAIGLVAVICRRSSRDLERLVLNRNQDLMKARDRLELALTGGCIGLWDWNAQTNEVYYSPTYVAQLGYPPETIWSQFSDWERQLHPDDFDKAHETVRRYFAREDQDYRSTFRLRCQDGSYRWMLAQGRAEFDASGTPLRMIGVHVDITERIETEEELKRLNLALEHANVALQESNLDLQQFAYVASHDLQTPLRAIAGFSQFLQKDYYGKIDERANDYINRIVGGVKRMQKMIDDLLEFSRVESRAAPFEVVALNQVFEDAVGLLQASILDTGATVTRDDLPSVNGDPAQLSQLLTNLIGNAIKYHHELPVVHVSAVEQDASYWTISIRDNGIGIAEKDHERIFEVFRRLHSRDQYPGTGIGLAVCRRIVKRHGGKIWVESKLGEGSTFHISLPRQGLRR
jgi:PAS domain S-box-containing protein